MKKITLITLSVVSLLCLSFGFGQKAISLRDTLKSPYCLNQEVNFYLKGSIIEADWNENLITEITQNRVSFDYAPEGDYDLKFNGLVMNNLVTNGNFEQGNTGFQTNYRYSPKTNLDGAGSYNIDTEVNKNGGGLSWYSWTNHCMDHTYRDGNYLFADGSTTPNDVFWSQTIKIEKNTTYDFYAYLMSFNTENEFTSYEYTPTIQVAINGTPILANPFVHENVICAWEEIHTTWFSDSLEGEVTLSLYSPNSSGKGNEFAIDDIMFGIPFQDSLSFSVELEDCYDLQTGYSECKNDTSKIYAQLMNSKTQKKEGITVWNIDDEIISDDTIQISPSQTQNLSVSSFLVEPNILVNTDFELPKDFDWYTTYYSTNDTLTQNSYALVSSTLRQCPSCVEIKDQVHENGKYMLVRGDNTTSKYVFMSEEIRYTNAKTYHLSFDVANAAILSTNTKKPILEVNIGNFNYNALVRKIEIAGNNSWKTINFFFEYPANTLLNIDIKVIKAESINGDGDIYFALDNISLNEVILKSEKTNIINPQECNIVTSLNETDNQIVIYPNPVSEFLYIDHTTTESQISIYNSLGTLMYKGNDRSIDVQNWKKGIYLYRILNNSLNSTGQIIVE